MDIENGCIRRAARGQAMVEMAMAMFVLMLVAGALFSFGRIIMASMDQQSHLREEAGRKALNAYSPPDVRVRFESARDSDTVELEPVAADYLFDEESVKVGNEVHMPAMSMEKALN